METCRRSYDEPTFLKYVQNHNFVRVRYHLISLAVTSYFVLLYFRLIQSCQILCALDMQMGLLFEESAFLFLNILMSNFKTFKLSGHLGNSDVNGLTV